MSTVVGIYFAVDIGCPQEVLEILETPLVTSRAWFPEQLVDIIIILYTLELNKCKGLHLLQIFIAFHFILNEMLILLLKIFAEIMSVIFLLFQLH